MLSDIVIILLLILIKGITTTCSTSLSVMDIRRTKYISDKDDLNYEKISNILANSQKYINASGIVNAFLGIVIGFLLALNVFSALLDFIYNLIGTQHRIANILTAFIIILVFTYLFALFSIIIPKIVAHKCPDKVVLKFIWILKFFSFYINTFYMGY